METKIAVFQGKEIRKVLYHDKWWFSVSDVVEVLTDSAGPKQYIKKMRQRDSELNSYWGTICTPLEILASDGKAFPARAGMNRYLFCFPNCFTIRAHRWQGFPGQTDRDSRNPFGKNSGVLYLNPPCG